MSLIGQTEAAQLVAIVQLPGISRSLRYRPYTDRLGGEPLLRKALSWLRALSPDLQIAVACQDDAEASVIRSSIGDMGAAVLVVCCQSRVQACALAELVSRFRPAHIALVPLGVILSPSDLLSRVFQHHLSSNSDCTHVVGFPQGTVPDIYRGDFVAFLRDLRLPEAADLRSTVQLLLTAHHACSDESPLNFCATTFDACRSYGADRSQVPQLVDLNTAPSVAEARAFLASQPPAAEPASGPELLYAFKRYITRRRREQYRDLIEAALGRPCAPSSRRGGPPRVLYISNASAYSGPEDSLCRMVERIDAARFEKSGLVALDGVFLDRLRQAGANVICQQQEFGTATVSHVLYVLGVLRQVQPDIIHINNCNIGLAPVCAATLLRIPIIQHVRITELAAFAEPLRVCSRVIAVSEHVRNCVSRLDIDPDTVEVIYDGVDTALFAPGCVSKAEARKRLGLPEDARIVLMVARFAPEKRHDVLLRAAARVRQSVSALRVVLVGEVFGSPHVYDSVRNNVNTLGLSDVVTFLGFQDDMRTVEAAADVQVLCSDAEALGTSILESMSLEVPVVITDAGGLRELVQDGDNGFVVGRGDSVSLGCRLSQLLSNPVLAADIGRAGRATVQERASAVICAKQVMAVYDRVVAARAESAPAVLHS